MFRIIKKLVKYYNCLFKLKFSSVCYLLIFYVSGVQVQGQQATFLTNSFNEEITGASKVNYWVTQDSKGKMLFANGRGLLCFDGQNWQLNTFEHKNENTLSIQYILPEKDTTWVAANNEIGFLTKKKGKYQFQSLKTGKHAEEKLRIPNQILRFKDQLFFLYVDKIIVIKHQKISQVIKAQRGTLFGYLFEFNRELFVSQYRKGLMVWKNNKFILRDENVLYKKSFAFLRTKTSQGVLTVFADQGLWLKKNNTLEKMKFSAKINNILSDIDHPRLYDQDHLLFCTLSGKAYLLNLKTKKIQEIFAGKGFVKGVHIDAQRNIWIVNYESIYQVEVSSPFSLLLHKKNILDLISTPDGLFAYNSARDSIAWITPKQPIKKIAIPGRIQAFCYHAPTQLLASSTKGVFLVDYAAQTVKKILNKANNQSIESDLFQPNRFYLSTTDGLYIYQLQQGKVKLLRSLQEKDVMTILRTQKYLWISALASNVIRYTLDSLDLPQQSGKKTYGTKQGDFTGNDQSSFFHYWQGKVWVNNPGGLYVYEDKREKFIPVNIQRTDTTQDFFASLVTFKQDQILVSGQSNRFSEMGIAHKTREHQYTLYNIPFRRLPNYEFRNLITHQGKFYAATSKGILCYDPNNSKNYQAKFQTLLSKITQGTQYLDSQTILKYGQNQVNFEFTSSYLEVPKKTQFAYQLAGLENKWSGWTSENKKEYNNLREGKYTFRVKARNIYGVEGTVATFSFEILPPWYRTWWAYSLYGLLALLGILGAFRLYTYRIRLRNKQLEQLVQTRTLDLHEANEELTAANEQLKDLGELKESFSQMLIHDARQPLTPLLNSTDPLVKSSGQRLQNYFDNFLEVQKFEAVEVKINIQTITIGQIVEEAIEQVRFAANQKLIKIHNYIVPHLQVNADEFYLLRVFTNLLNNAIKYIPNSGMIVLSAQFLTKDNQNPFLKIWVKDNGSGIPDQLKSTIFDKFSRADKSDKRSTGLGLAFCKMALEAQGGEIGVLTQSERMQNGETGAAFWLTIPYEVTVMDDSVEDTNPQPIVVQYQFTTKDKELIKDLLPQLKQLEYCDSSDIEAIFDHRTWQGSEALEAWIYSLPFQPNQQVYLQQLTDIS